MIFADKLIQLRKKSGWSQEDLAEQMNVSRQSVSKWEGAQSVPDLEKMVRLSELFGVSTDYLLKDEIETATITDIDGASEEISSVRKLSLEEANSFISLSKIKAKFFAIATALCILSPVTLFLLIGNSEQSILGVSIGIIVLLIFVAAAIAMFVSSSSKVSQFRFLENDSFETEYGVIGMVKSHKEKYQNAYTRNNIIGVIILVFSVVPLFIGIMINEYSDMLLISMLAVTFVLVAIGVMILVNNITIWNSFEMILQEGDYSHENKNKSPLVGAIATAYWLLATAIYLGYSLVTDNWDFSWIIWPVAGVIFPALMAITSAITKKNK